MHHTLSQQPTNPTTFERTVECTRCTAKSITPPFISFTLPVRSKPTHCPKCGHTRTVRPYDYADIICTDHAGISRNLAIKAINLYNEQLARGTLGHKSHIPDCIGYIEDMGVDATNMPSMRSSFAPIDAHCTSCGGSYTMLRNVPDVQRTPPLYCVWCGSKSVTIQQQSTDQTCWTSLAQHYNLPLAALKMFYDRWSRKSSLSSFSNYMQSDLITQLLQDAGLAYIEQASVPSPELPAISTMYANTPNPATIAIVLEDIYVPSSLYSTCTICDCEMPQKSVKAYCEPCQITVKSLRYQQHTFTSKGGC